MAVAGLLSPWSAARASDEDPPARYQFPEVERAWREGGEDGVKDWMKQLLKRAKASKQRLASGAKPKCGACHENLRDYAPRPNAVDDLRALLESSPGPPP